MISVCIATFNGEKYIEKQIKSILSQLKEDDEIIISDDYSTDNTLEIIKNFSDKRIKIFLNPNTKGYTSNFENSLAHAKGEIIFLSDQDDIWENNKVEKNIDYLYKYDLVISDAKIIDDQGEIINDSYYKVRKATKSIGLNIIRFSGLGCCMCFNKKILKKALPFPTNHHLATHDNWLFLIGALYYKAEFIPDKLVLYRRHNSNASNGGFKQKTNLVFMIKYRIYLFNNLLKRIL